MIIKVLLKIQQDLFEAGSQLASSKRNKKIDIYLEKRVKEFEDSIDKWAKILPKLEHFVLPEGKIRFSPSFIQNNLPESGKKSG